MSTYVPLERALERFDAAVRPTPRTLREKMLLAGCALRYGRRVVTTNALIERFFADWRERWGKAGNNVGLPVYLVSGGRGEPVGLL